MPVSDCAAGLAAHPPVLGTFQGSPQPGGATRSRWHPATNKASGPPISRPTAAEPRPAPPVVLQRMSLPADRHPRRPTRGKFINSVGSRQGPYTFHCVSLAGRSRFSRHPAGPAARGLAGFRLVSAHPADHSFLLLAAGLCVAGVGGVSLTFLHPMHQPG